MLCLCTHSRCFTEECQASTAAARRARKRLTLAVCLPASLRGKYINVLSLATDQHSGQNTSATLPHRLELDNSSCYVDTCCYLFYTLWARHVLSRPPQASMTYGELLAVVTSLASSESAGTACRMRNKFRKRLADLGGPEVGAEENLGVLLSFLFGKFRRNPEVDSQFTVSFSRATMCQQCNSRHSAVPGSAKLLTDLPMQDNLPAAQPRLLIAARNCTELQQLCDNCQCTAAVAFNEHLRFRKCVVLIDCYVDFRDQTVVQSSFPLVTRIDCTDLRLVFLAIQVARHWIAVALHNDSQWVVYDDRLPHLLVKSLAEAADNIVQRYPNPENLESRVPSVEVAVYQVL